MVNKIKHDYINIKERRRNKRRRIFKRSTWYGKLLNPFVEEITYLDDKPVLKAILYILVTTGIMLGLMFLATIYSF